MELQHEGIRSNTSGAAVRGERTPTNSNSSCKFPLPKADARLSRDRALISAIARRSRGPSQRTSRLQAASYTTDPLRQPAPVPHVHLTPSAMLTTIKFPSPSRPWHEHPPPRLRPPSPQGSRRPQMSAIGRARAVVRARVEGCGANAEPLHRLLFVQAGQELLEGARAKEIIGALGPRRESRRASPPSSRHPSREASRSA